MGMRYFARLRLCRLMLLALIFLFSLTAQKSIITAFLNGLWAYYYTYCCLVLWVVLVVSHTIKMSEPMAERQHVPLLVDQL